MTDVQARAAGVGEHIHDHELGAARHPVEASGERAGRVRGVERSVRLPAILPARFDLARYARAVAERWRLIARALAGAGAGPAGVLAHETPPEDRVRARKSPSR